MKLSFQPASLQGIQRLGATLAEHLGPGDTVLLSGPVGAGKTELARNIIQARLQACGALEDVPSPTYTLVQTYELPGVQIWHADLYRLTSVEELYELGLESAFEDCICLVEWPERLGQLRPPDALTVSLGIVDDNRRRVSLECSANRWNSVLSLFDNLNFLPG